MPGPRLPMRKIRDVLRLSAAGMSKRQIAASLGVSATAAGECIRRARRAGLGWPLPEGLADETLECRLYPPPAIAAKGRRPQPEWAAVHRELRRKLPPEAALSNDYRTPRRLDKALFQQLTTCRWIAEHRSLLVTGPCGVGKSWLSCALAQKACRDGHTVHYARVPRLFADIDLAHGDGRFARLFRMLVKVDLLVLDDWGPDRLSAGQRRDLMEIVEDRHGRGSILITSQLPVATWHEVIGEPTLGDAILDRIVHNAYRLELDGPSMRKLTASEAPAAPAAPVTASAADGKPSKGAKK